MKSYENIVVPTTQDAAMCTTISSKYKDLKSKTLADLNRRGVLGGSIEDNAMKKIELERINELELFGCPTDK